MLRSATVSHTLEFFWSSHVKSESFKLSPGMDEMIVNFLMRMAFVR